MRTAHSINLKLTNDKCFGNRMGGPCAIMVVPHKDCGTWRCPMYKPQGCKDWVRVEEGNDVTLIPPEEYACARKEKPGIQHPTWKITHVPSAGRR